MKECLNCGVELHGLQKMFCSKKCKSTSRWSRMTEDERIKQREVNRKIYKDKRVERLEEKKKYYLKNREEIIKKNNKYKKENPESDIKYSNSIKGKLRDYKTGAKKRKLVFELDLDYFENNWNKECAYCGDIINGIGIDRKDNDIGYTIENSVLCCGMCNRMKHAFTEQDFINQCIKITNNLK